MRRQDRTVSNSGLFGDLLSCQEQVFRICLGFAKNVADAEDLVQEVYLKAYRKLNTLKNLNLAKEWLLRIARNTCLDHNKKRRWTKLLTFGRVPEAPEMKNPEMLMDEKEQIQILKESISKLPQKQKEVFILREYGELAYNEIALMLGIKEGTVMSRLNRARQAILSLMRGENL